MKVLQLAAYYPPSLGGIQFYVQSLSRALVKQDCEVTVLTMNTEANAPSEETQGSLRIKRCQPDLNIYRALISREFNRLLMKATEYDVYHLHIPFHVGLEMSVIAAKRNGIPLVVTHHGQSWVGSPLYTLAASSYSYLSQALVLRGVQRLIFLTQSYAEELWLPRSVRSKTRIVRTGADIERFSPTVSGENLRQTLGLSASTPTLLFVGSLHRANRYKGVDYLLKAMLQVKTTLPNVRLLIVGAGELLSEWQALAKQLELEDTVTFLGAIDNHHLPEFYAVADSLVLPSLHGPENSPVVVFEAMASGKPVIASDLAGVRDIVTQDSGVLVPPRDVDALARAITTVLSDSEFRKKAALHARQRAEMYSWDHCAREMLQNYQEV